MKQLGVIESEPIVQLEDGSVTYKSKAAIDDDGSGPSEGDPDYQNDTSLHQNGKALNAETEKYVVVPPLIIDGVSPIVLGCQAFVLNLTNGQSSEAVVGDVGPNDKIGEISPALADALGIPDSPTTGGIESHTIFYHIIPGRYAVVDGKAYGLQAS